MLAPGHKGQHQSVLMLDGEVGFIHWGLPPAPEPEVAPEVPVAIEAPPARGISPPLPPPAGIPYRSMQGRCRRRAEVANPYAAFDEGIHFNWDIHGHEVLPLPTLDEIERKMS
jgi:hypothetical protein